MKTEKIKRVELIKLMHGFDMVKDLKGVKFAYAVAKNRRVVEAEVNAMQEALKPTKEFEEYDKKRIVICEKYCERDEKGKPLFDAQNNYKDVNGNPAFEAEIKVLKEEYAEALDERRKTTEDYNKMLEEEIEFTFHKVLQDDLPKDITAGQLSAITLIIFMD